MRNRQNKTGATEFEIRMWFKDRKGRSTVKTMASLVDNMITGVTKVQFSPNFSF